MDNKTSPPSSDPESQARADLAQRLGIAGSQVELVELKKVIWRDSSLGCPQPGMFYTQVLQEGFLIRLRARSRAGDRIYEYHSGGNRAPFLCENPSELKPLDPGSSAES